MSTARRRTDGRLARVARKALAIDLLLSAVCIAGAATIAFMLVHDVDGVGGLATGGAAKVGRLEAAAGEVRRRPTRTLVWELIRAGEDLGESDTLFVSPGGDAIVRLVDGARLEVHENSLVVIERGPGADSAGLAIGLARGSLSGTAGGDALAVRAAGGTARLPVGASAQIAVAGTAQARIDVFAGAVAVEGQGGAETVRPSEAALVGGGRVSRTSGYPVVLQAPEPGARFFMTTKPPEVQLSWEAKSSDETWVEVRRDGELLARAEAGRGRLLVAPRATGTYTWQAVGPGGKPASPTWRFVVELEEPPLLSVPPDRQVVSVTGDDPLLFAWTPVAGASRYSLELAADRGFAEVVKREDVEATRFWLTDALPERTYYWRVRVADAARPRAPFSQPSVFRLVTRPLPAAPELLDAVVELP